MPSTALDHHCMLLEEPGELQLPLRHRAFLPRTSKKLREATAGDRCPLCAMSAPTRLEADIYEHYGNLVVGPAIVAAAATLMLVIALLLQDWAAARIFVGILLPSALILLTLWGLEVRYEFKTFFAQRLSAGALGGLGSSLRSAVTRKLLEAASGDPASWKRVTALMREHQALSASLRKFGEVLSSGERVKVAARVREVEGELHREAAALEREKRARALEGKREALAAHLAALAALPEASTAPEAALARVLSAPEAASYPPAKETPGVFVNYR